MGLHHPVYKVREGEPQHTPEEAGKGVLSRLSVAFDEDEVDLWATKAEAVLLLPVGY